MYISVNPCLLTPHRIRNGVTISSFVVSCRPLRAMTAKAIQWGEKNISVLDTISDKVCC